MSEAKGCSATLSGEGGQHAKGCFVSGAWWVWRRGPTLPDCCFWSGRGASMAGRRSARRGRPAAYRASTWLTVLVQIGGVKSADESCSCRPASRQIVRRPRSSPCAMHPWCLAGAPPAKRRQSTRRLFIRVGTHRPSYVLGLLLLLSGALLSAARVVWPAAV